MKKRSRLDEENSKKNNNAYNGFNKHVKHSQSAICNRNGSGINSSINSIESSYISHVFSLNNAFKVSLLAQEKSNCTSVWDDSMRAYLSSLENIAKKFGKRSGTLLTFGSGDCGQLAHGVESDEDMIVNFPRVVRALSSILISSVSCGGLHTAAITENGTIYTWGCNDDGALGRLGEENMPRIVHGFGPSEPNQAIQVVAGDCHTLALTSKGRVYVWGSYKDKEGKLWCDAINAKASYRNKQLQPFLIRTLEDISDICCGSCFNLARTQSGQVYSWGLGELGQLGRKVEANFKNERDDYDQDLVFNSHLTPAQVSLGIEPISSVKAIGCGSYHSLLVVGPNGYLYTCGLNNYGQLGVGSTENYPDLQLVEDLVVEHVVQAEGGTHHSAVLTSKGDVYTFGRADSGQLGTHAEWKTGDFRERPQKVEFCREAKITSVKSISCGSNHMLALTNDKQVYSWGYGDMMALGHGTEQDELTPKQINIEYALSSRTEVVQIDAGGQHSAIIISVTE